MDWYFGPYGFSGNNKVVVHLHSVNFPLVPSSTTTFKYFSTKFRDLSDNHSLKVEKELDVRNVVLHNEYKTIV